MNPYTYHKGRHSLASQDQPVKPAASGLSIAASWIKSVCNYNFSSATALTFVLFAATAIGSTAFLAQSEISMGEYSPMANVSMHKGQVLGVASYGYNQPICGYNTANCLNYQLVGYNNGGWQVRIDYQLTGNITGAVKVNNWPFMDNIKGSGSGYTGNDLQPGVTYNFILYKKVGNSLTKLTSLSLTGPAAPGPSCPPLPAPPANCRYETTGQCGGNLVCYPPPSYGYTTPNWDNKPGHLIEGWIESMPSNNLVAPGNVTLSGWAYNNGLGINVSMTLLNTDNGQQYGSGNVIYSAYRSDITNYITQRIGSQPGFQNGMFALTFSNLPVGHYQIYNARYNGILFNVHNQIGVPIYVAPGMPIQLVTLSFNEVNIPPATSGQQYAGTINWMAQNATTASTFTATVSNTLPPGINISPNGLAGAPGAPIIIRNITAPMNLGSATMSGKFIFSGTPTQPGTYPVVINLVLDSNPNVVASVPFNIIVSQSSATARVGQLVNVNGTVYLVGSTGLYSIPNLDVFNSWNWSFTQVLIANTAELKLPVLNVQVPMRSPYCNNALDQIAGKCPVPTPTPTPTPTTVATSTSASVTLTLDPASASGLTYQAGAIDVEGGKFRLNAVGDYLNITHLTAYIKSPSCSATNAKIIDLSTGTQVGSTSAVVGSNGSCLADFYFNLLVNKNSYKTLALRFSIPANAPAETYVAGLGNVGYLSISQGLAGSLLQAVYGNLLTVTSASINHAPSSPQMTLGPSGNVTVGVAQQFNFKSTDPDSDNLSYFIGWSDGGASTTVSGLSGALVAASHTWSAAGAYTIFVTVSDGKGGAAQATFNVTVAAAGGQTVTPRIGTLVYNSTTFKIYVVEPLGLYTFSDFNAMLSWGFNYTQAVIENSAEQALPVAGNLDAKKLNCSSIVQQLAGTCGN